jgi:RNA 2',3'-cyclic 3'-phosphodiesterase
MCYGSWAMRLFVGIDIDDLVRERAAAIGESAQALLEPALVIRWVPAENLHVTLWFLGEVAEPRTPAVLAAIDRPFGIPPFDLHVAGFGAFPPTGIPRVFWLGVREGIDSLAFVHAGLARRLHPLGFQPERRPFSAHLTLGRVKVPRRAARGRDWRRSWSELSSDAGVCRVDAVTVFRSRLSPKGATYDRLVRVPLF